MKRIYIAISLILLTVLICTVSSRQINKKALLMKDELGTVAAELSADNTENAKNMLERATETKNSLEKTLSFFVDADKIEEFNISFAMTRAHLEDENNEHALESLHRCELMLEEILENEKISLKNIM